MNMCVELGSPSSENMYWEVCVEVCSAGRIPSWLPEASWLPMGCLAILNGSWRIATQRHYGVVERQFLNVDSLASKLDNLSTAGKGP